MQAALVKTPAAPRKTRQRTTQLKLAGIATIQPDAPVEPSAVADKAEKADKVDKGDKAGDKAKKPSVRPARMSASRDANEGRDAQGAGRAPDEAAEQDLAATQEHQDELLLEPEAGKGSAVNHSKSA